MGASDTMVSMPVVAVEPLAGFALRLTFADGAAERIDLAHLAAGALARWRSEAEFAAVVLTAGGDLVWENGVEMAAADALRDMAGQRPDDVLAPLRQISCACGREPHPPPQSD